MPHVTEDWILTAEMPALPDLAMPYLQEVGHWEQSPTSGYDTPTPPVHWHAELGLSCADVDVLVGGCGTTERGWAFVGVLMRDICRMGVRLSVEQTQFGGMVDRAAGWPARTSHGPPQGLVGRTLRSRSKRPHGGLTALQKFSLARPSLGMPM